MTYVDDSSLPVLSDEEFAAFRSRAKEYTVCLLKAGPNYETLGRNTQGAPSEIVFEHGRRNVALHTAGLLPIVCPVTDGGPLKGVGIYSGDLDEVRRIMEVDPGVKAGIFVFDLHPCRGFPGSSLPG